VEVTQNVSESHVEGAIAIARSGGRENDHGRGYGIHAIAAGIHRPREHHDLQCRGSGAVWAKVNGCRVAGAQVSESEAGNCRVEICRCGHDAVSHRGLLFRLSLQPFPPCAPFCVVFARRSPLLSLPRLDSRAHPPVLRELWVSHLCPCLVCSRMIPSLTAQTHCVCVNECPGGNMNNERDIQRDGECLCLCFLDFTDLFRALFL
jgi:hypothetical protein